MKYIQSSVHQFSNLFDAPFSIEDYSRLKFGSDIAAKKFGYELAIDFASKHMDTLLANRCVVIPSPYNHVANAATILTHHFINKLNSIIVQKSGEHVEYDVIKRKVSYINDYGFLSKDKRRDLINQDSFFLNRDFYEGKTLIFIDDVKITGTHEDKLKDILKEKNINNDVFFLYYAKYNGDSPEIESKINFASLKNVQDYINISQEPNHHIIVRPIKYLLSLDYNSFKKVIENISKEKVDMIYHGCLGEGYYKIPSYQNNFGLLANFVAENA